MPQREPLTEAQRLTIEALEKAEKEAQRKANIIAAEIRRIKGEPTTR
jgi:hypothetical protein